MENATDALVMAASVLLFMMALALSITSFSSLRRQVDDIVESTEMISLAQDESGDYINYIRANDDIREVGVETVMSSIRRVNKENFNVYIVGDIANESELADFRITAEKEQLYIVDADDRSKDRVLTKVGNNILKISLADKHYTNLKKQELLDKLFDKLNGKRFKEYLGEYMDNSKIDSVNKDTYRVITYVQI